MIKAIIFDFGGVVQEGKYDASFARTIAEKHGKSFDEVYPACEKYLNILDSGVPIRFLEKFSKDLGIELEHEEFLGLLEKAVVINLPLIKVIKELKKTYNILMLSDNDEFLVPILEEKFKEIMGLFEHKSFSYKVGACKPDPKMYKDLLRKAGLEAKDCVFIDDLQRNIDGAKRLGMKGIVYNNLYQVKEQLRKLGVQIG